MFANLEVKDLFPTPIWVADMDPVKSAKLNETLSAEIYRLTEPRKPVQAGGTWQTDPVLQQRPEFAEFVTLVNQAARAALDFLKVSYKAIEITGCWANINPHGGQNSPHMHPNNFLSGVYYVALPDDAGQITFADPRPQAQMIMPRVKSWNKYMGNEIKLETKPGRFVLFPAWLTHSVPVNRSEAHRISISFNIMFSDFTAEMSRPLWKGTAALRSD